MDRNLFIDCIKKFGGEISEEKLNHFDIYSSLLVEWNEKMNLTAITDPEGISVRHFADSVSPLFYHEFKENAKIIDVGTGAGFPGFPIKILRPDLEITLMDSLNKRINFLKEVREKTGISNVECVHARAEEFSRKPEYREKYDIGVSRAVANLRVLSEYVIPFIKIGGYFIAMKAMDIEEEVNDAKEKIKALGGEIQEIKTIEIPNSDVLRKLVIIKKINKTDNKYPSRKIK
ncbi:MAG: 16S rRNA (guanine(527)-N(7))-methyltransferase RsmG [Ruminococcaceae bacterium]|nr:16S rRNA (guanine(527)-N(7))-methyltransferase RsmG [Oscillospiraceae bacterium]